MGDVMTLIEKAENIMDPVSSPRIVPQSVFLSAAEALSKIVSEDDLENGSLFPSLTKIREVSQSTSSFFYFIYYFNILKERL